MRKENQMDTKRGPNGYEKRVSNGHERENIQWTRKEWRTPPIGEHEAQNRVHTVGSNGEIQILIYWQANNGQLLIHTEHHTKLNSNPSLTLSTGLLHGRLELLLRCDHLLRRLDSLESGEVGRGTRTERLVTSTSLHLADHNVITV